MLRQCARIVINDDTGLGLLYTIVKSSIDCKDLEGWRSLFDRAGSYTVAGKVINYRVLFTAEPENVKVRPHLESDE